MFSYALPSAHVCMRICTVIEMKPFVFGHLTIAVNFPYDQALKKWLMFPHAVLPTGRPSSLRHEAASSLRTSTTRERDTRPGIHIRVSEARWRLHHATGGQERGGGDRGGNTVRLVDDVCEEKRSSIGRWLRIVRRLIHY